MNSGRHFAKSVFIWFSNNQCRSPCSVCSKVTHSVQYCQHILPFHWWQQYTYHRDRSIYISSWDCPFNAQQRNGRHTMVDLGSGWIGVMNIHKLHPPPSCCVWRTQRSHCCSWLMACSIINTGGFIIWHYPWGAVFCLWLILWRWVSIHVGYYILNLVLGDNALYTVFTYLGLCDWLRLFFSLPDDVKDLVVLIDHVKVLWL